DENVAGGGGQVAGTLKKNTQRDPGGPNQYLVYSEQFVVIWMTANAPTLKESTPSSLEFPTQADGTPSTAVFPSSGPNGPDVNAAAVGQLSGTGVKNLDGNGIESFLGDATTLNQFGLDQWGWDVPWDKYSWDGGANDTPETNNGLLQVRVTGSFPV